MYTLSSLLSDTLNYQLNDAVKVPDSDHHNFQLATSGVASGSLVRAGGRATGTFKVVESLVASAHKKFPQSLRHHKALLLKVINNSSERWPFLIRL